MPPASARAYRSPRHAPTVADRRAAYPASTTRLRRAATSACTNLECATRDIDVVERVLDARDFLIRLVALARDQHYIARPRLTQGLRNCLRAIALHDGRLRPRESVENLRDDSIAVFVARIVVGDDDAIGQTFGDAAHLRAFARVALTAATEHANQFPGAVCTQTGQRLFERVGRMRIVDDDKWRVRAATEPVHTPHDRLHPCKRALDLFEGKSERAQDSGDREQI